MLFQYLGNSPHEYPGDLELRNFSCVMTMNEAFKEGQLTTTISGQRASRHGNSEQWDGLHLPNS